MIKLLLFVLAISNISAAYVVRNIPRNNEIVTHEHPYPPHPVKLDLATVGKVDKVCIRWYDYTQEEVKRDCDFDLNGEIQKVSPSFAIGYAFTYETSFKNGGTLNVQEPVFWWDGWVGMAYCNYLVKDKSDIVSYKYSIQWKECRN